MLDYFPGIIRSTGTFHAAKTELTQAKTAAAAAQEQLAASRETTTSLEARVGELTTSLADTIQSYEDTIWHIRQGQARKGETMIEWEQAFKEQMEAVVARGDALESAAFGFLMDFVARRYPEVPFVYYDLRNRMVFYTPATLELLNVNVESEGEEPNRLTLKKLLGYVGKEYRHHIIESMRHGTSLKRYQAETSGDDQRSLIISSYPMSFNNMAMGVGILLYDAVFQYPGTKVRSWRLIKSMQRAFSDMSDRLAELYPRPGPDIAFAVSRASGKR